MTARKLLFKKLGLPLAIVSLLVLMIVAPALAAQVTLLNDGFENTSTPFADWDGNGSTNWGVSTLNFHSGARSARGSNGNEGNLTSDNLDASNAQAITIDFWYRKSFASSSTFTLYYFNGSSYNLIYDLGVNGANNTWIHYTQTITGSQYFISNFRIRFNGVLNGAQNIYVDDVLITKDTGETLTVNKPGTGTGTVTSTPAGFNCGATCSVNFATNTLITLSAAAGTGSTFAGWNGGGCTGTGSCVVTMDMAKTVDATFNLTEYTLTVTSAHGTVAKLPDQPTYHYGDVVQLTATPEAGWSFASWSGDVTGTANPVSVTVQGNIAATANYIQEEYTLTVTSAHGTVVKSPDQPTYHYGDVVQLTVTPEAGWSFASWSGDVTGTANPVSVTVHGNTAVTASYTQDEYTVTVTSAHGTVAKSPDQPTYHYGDVVQLTATPEAGWSFASWSGDVTATANPVSVTVHSNTAVTANYTQDEYTLTVTSADGTVAKFPDQPIYHYGEVVQLTATPEAGWSFASWSGDVTDTANPLSVTVHGNTAVTADYTQDEYTLTVTSAHGTVAKFPDQPTYHYGTVVQLTATPEAGWSFASWSGGVTDTANPVSVTVHGNTAVTANYIQDEYTLTVTSAHGTVVKSPDQPTYHYGDVVQLTATPEAGWGFASWSGDITDTANPVSVTVHGNTSVTANYTLNQYLLIVVKNGTGTVNSLPAGIDCGGTCSAGYDNNTQVTLSAVAAAGWTFAGWSGGGCSGTGTCVVTMNAAKTVTATFTKNQFLYFPIIF